MPRAFVAIEIDEATRQKLVSVQERLRATGAQLKLVEPPNIHITMKFLGEVPDDRIAPISEALERAAAGTKQFDVRVRGIGVFPNLNYIRVVWAGVSDGRDEVTALQQKIERELRPLGFRPEMDFVPHLTIARVKTAKAKERLAAFVGEMSDTEFGISRAQAVELKQSTLTQKGPVYSTLAKIELG
jgi:2'-5' RNA ligase